MKKNIEEILKNSNGLNCCQKTVNAFAEDLNIDMETTLKMTAGFGSGLTQGEVCGAVSGACITIGLKYGSANIQDEEAKRLTKEKVSKFMQNFKKEHKVIRCKELLGYDCTTPEGLKEIGEQGLHQKLCPKFIGDAIRLTEEII
ncbi:C_GCAxxG_C_C family probable redox protein [Lutibacter oricola]|uniref:C_GCAxxG_C_C family probable redox protein n=1 Tax=Lutibacter oricola TaxID=762486 RepID=A0A1H2XGT6_9FLAO|nr:C-GCAxxG-C-C family protein [Lutibacter oricola]SDW92102.1 C_GCAxxG_C_C family probable redox protein [Lutibacter oricola]